MEKRTKLIITVVIVAVALYAIYKLLVKGQNPITGNPVNVLKSGEYHGCTCGTVEMQAPAGVSCSEFCSRQGAQTVAGSIANNSQGVPTYTSPVRVITGKVPGALSGN